MARPVEWRKNPALRPIVSRALLLAVLGFGADYIAIDLNERYIAATGANELYRTVVAKWLKNPKVVEDGLVTPGVFSWIQKRRAVQRRGVYRDLKNLWGTLLWCGLCEVRFSRGRCPRCGETTGTPAQMNAITRDLFCKLVGHHNYSEWDSMEARMAVTTLLRLYVKRIVVVGPLIRFDIREGAGTVHRTRPKAAAVT